jgi:ubiquinone/menaquinone biosynthesis C-methylase UbiE
MVTEEQTRAYYDDFSIGYERERGRNYHGLIDELELRVTRPLCRGARVLEVGCGTGLILEELAREADEACGIDLSPGMLKKATDRGLNGVLGSATEIPFDDGSFDLTCSFKVLAHVPEIDKALSEMARVTRPGGHLVLEFYNPWSLRYLAKKIAGPLPISANRTEADVFTRWDTPPVIRKRLPAELELVDFRGVRVVTPAAFVYKIPGVGELFRRAEGRALHSSFRYFGGFLLAILRKRDA